MKDLIFPSNATLEDAVLEALASFNGRATTKQINLKVIELLALPTEVVELEDESGLGTKLDYRLRWCRTNLKSKGLIINEKKGTWCLVR